VRLDEETSVPQEPEAPDTRLGVLLILAPWAAVFGVAGITAFLIIYGGWLFALAAWLLILGVLGLIAGTVVR
jgi:hypothetical protein